MYKQAITATILIALLVVQANASISTEPYAISGYSGASSISISQAGSILDLNIEYAVFAPDTYSGYDMSAGNDYIYAYQITNYSSSNVAADFFSVGIIAGASVNNVYTDSSSEYSAGGVVPTAFEFPNSAAFVFMTQSLNSGQHSAILLLSSQYAPQMGFASVSGGGLAEMANVAAPSNSTTAIPEPATVAILIPAVMAVVNKRRKSKK